MVPAAHDAALVLPFKASDEPACFILNAAIHPLAKCSGVAFGDGRWRNGSTVRPYSAAESSA